MKFFEALQLKNKEVVALAGAGGKTSTMYAIGQEARQKGLKTILTTTTKIFQPVENTGFKVIISDKPEELYYKVQEAIKDNNLIVVAKGLGNSDSNQSGKLLGLDKDLYVVLTKIFQGGEVDLIVVEADGAARKPFKAPAKHEPVIPENTTLVIPVVGIDCLGKPIKSEFVHRAEVIAELAGVKLGEKITTEIIAKVFISTLGYRKGLPPKASWVPFINKVVTSADLDLAREIAVKIARQASCKVLIGAALAEEPVKEVII